MRTTGGKLSRTGKSIYWALGLLTVAVLFGAYFFHRQGSILRDSQVESCQRGNVFRSQAWDNYLGDAQDAYYLWGQEHDPEKRSRYLVIFKRKEYEARALVAYAQRTGYGEPGQPTIRCEELIR